MSLSSLFRLKIQLFRAGVTDPFSNEVTDPFSNEITDPFSNEVNSLKIHLE